MKVAISSSGKELTSQLNPRFGRCTHFLILDTEEMNHEAVDNDSAGLSGGAGIQTAQFLASKGVNAVITGNCGPNAVAALLAAEIELYTGQTGPVKDVFELYRKGSLTPTREANVDSHYGSGGGRGMGGGRGGGSGRGRNMG